jgi:predicted RNA-binding protein with TRAM domain
MQHKKPFLLLLILALITALALTTILAKDHKPTDPGSPTQVVDHGNGNGNGNNGNHGNGGGGQQQPPATDQPQSTPVPSDGQLGCQKNNPGRLDCSSLDVSGVCDGGMAVFTIHNSGEPGNGDMRAPTQYRIVVDGVVVETGSIQLAGGASMQITYSGGGGSVTLEADQQVGHPGNSHPRVTLDCGSSSVTNTPQPTPSVEPTLEPTATETPTVQPPLLSAEVFCVDDGSILFVVSNTGGNMLDSELYMVTDPNGALVDQGYIQLFTGEQLPLQYWGYLSLTLRIGDLFVIASPECAPVPPTATPEVQPPNLSAEASCMYDGSVQFIITNLGGDMTEAVYYTVTDPNGALVADGYVLLLSGEQLPLQYSGYPILTLTIGDLVVTSSDCTPTNPPVLEGNVYCQADGSIRFVIVNTGGDMLLPAYYTVTTPDGGFVADGWLQLFTGEQAILEYSGYPRLTFTMGNLVITQDAECLPPTPEPTQEVTPTPEPTIEGTPTVEPTQEFTPTPTPTDDGTLGCQKHNDGRLDCSSLQVTAVCDGDVAVFTITNRGERGNGDMRAPTEYRLIVDGVVVESGTAQLLGHASMQISYSAGGTVTLEADQQVGHPGQSQPQATISCSA